MTQRTHKITRITAVLSGEQQRAIPICFWPNGHLLLSLSEKRPGCTSIPPWALTRYCLVQDSGLCRDQPIDDCCAVILDHNSTPPSFSCHFPWSGFTICTLSPRLCLFLFPANAESGGQKKCLSKQSECFVYLLVCVHLICCNVCFLEIWWMCASHLHFLWLKCLM